MRPARQLTLIALIALALAFTAACGDREPESIPTGATPAVTFAPEPSFPELSDTELAAYEKAVQDNDELQDRLQPLLEDPESALAENGKKLDELVPFFYSPQGNTTGAGIRAAAENDVVVDGQPRVVWRVPVRVDLEAEKPVVVFRQCNELDGVVTVLKSGKDVPQKNKVTELVFWPDTAGDGVDYSTVRWRWQDSEEIGPC